MQTKVRGSAENCESLNFYKYLCHKIGSEEVVKIRRLALCIAEISELHGEGSIFSGSKGEGLNMKGSDLDIMLVNTYFKVYESETDVVHGCLNIPLIMHTGETQPCFTQLRLLNHDQSEHYKTVLHKNHLGYMLSSKCYKLFTMSVFSDSSVWRIHGPCISDNNEKIDLANCLKCDKWISQAQPWIYRPRTAWPSPDIISKIISYGVLFVPIGCKGSINENLEWRISFSVAEKFLIFSFSHTQLLCYSLLKILLKEIVEKYLDLKGVICSYFLKTLMFWISEETDPNEWRPDNIIPCFMACLQRLLYSVRYSILSHFFIPDNNLFYSRFNVMNKIVLETILLKLYQQGTHCFAFSETLKDYQKHFCNITYTESLSNRNFITALQNSPELYRHGNIKKIIYHCLNHSRTGLSRGIFALYLSKACRLALNASDYLYILDNKHEYYKYKFNLSLLLISLQSDAVSGWLKLASLFYAHNNYIASIKVIDYALQKYTDEKIFIGFISSELINALDINPLMCLETNQYTCIQMQALNLMKNENLYTVLKTLTIEAVQINSLIIPQELQQVGQYIHLYHPLLFAYFLSFLCYYHLQDNTACMHYLEQLTTNLLTRTDLINFPHLSGHIMLAIAYRLIGETYFARQLFQIIAEVEPSLSWLPSVIEF